MSLSLVLLNDTMRLHDNPLLQLPTAAKAALVVLDHHAFFGAQYGIARANLSRLQQQLAVITAVKQQLAAQHIGLITLVGNVAQRISELARELNATALYCAEPVAPNERQALLRLSPGLAVTQLDCNSLLGHQLRPTLATLPDSFTPFRKQLEPLLQVSPPLNTPLPPQGWLTMSQCEPYNSAFNQLASQYQPNLLQSVASEQGALARVTEFIWQGRHILTYKETRNQLLGQHYASFCSAPLALGSLSVRQLWQDIVQFEQQVAANDSTYWLKFELLWREYFRWQFRKYGNLWFSRNGIKQAIRQQPDFSPPRLSSRQQDKFQRWCAGQTGIDFVDANMQLLNKTGLMSNRGRQNVASYLIYDLALDWRLGAAYFEQRLLDYDCASNWGNWAYIAGTGNSSERRFNISKQAQLYDADGRFVRTVLQDASA
ncbi:DASH family cryptochrome [Rheinheimera nanhaiensis]|uniref:Cryptochrome DASH n=1 Tax=Rheinheimera nanhaiensis E407-8 TaxID=562729 RepID=I1DV02_9GAMM|nr:DASH family cryptochrome [Rheinheimera nanhaiensis]GAB57880.1 cryptochrome DASH [Rheinheimera nanhaiensis E407-8]